LEVKGPRRHVKVHQDNRDVIAKSGVAAPTGFAVSSVVVVTHCVLEGTTPDEFLVSRDWLKISVGRKMLMRLENS
jgi:hypothetical protein